MCIIILFLLEVIPKLESSLQSARIYKINNENTKRSTRHTYEDALGFTKQNKKYKITQKPTEKIQKRYPNLDIIFCPEFLTQRTAKLDMLTQARIIFGGDKMLTES